MDEHLKQCKLFQRLSEDEAKRLLSIGARARLREGDYLFLLGDDAERLYVVAGGKVDLCFPMTVGEVTKDIVVESAIPGKTLGWSALVKPYRFTLSARAAESGEVISFARADLLELFDAEPRIGYAFLAGISEIVGIRLLKMQAQWVRELQRALTAETGRRPQ